MRVEWDQEKNTISVGKALFTYYMYFKGREAWTIHVLRLNKITPPSGHPKVRNKFIADALGCSSVVLYKIFQKLQWKAFIVPYQSILFKIAYPRKRVDIRALKNIVKNYTKLKEVENDGLYHLLPIVAHTGLSPQELKQKYGKAWKKLANNSLNKNKILCKAIPALHILEYCDFPTTLLERQGYIRKDTMEFLKNNFKGKWSKPSECHDAKLFFRDTVMMAEQLGEKVSPAWTERRLREEHDRMARIITARKYSPEKLSALISIPVKKFHHKDFHAVLLCSALDIAEEGQAMSHCVASYINAVREGRYLVYSVRNSKGERVSTLGVSVWANAVPLRKYLFSQHFGRFDQVVTNQDERDLAKVVIMLLNEENEVMRTWLGRQACAVPLMQEVG